MCRSAEPPQDDFVAYEWELGEILSAFREADVRNVVWLTADVHWAQSIHYPDYRMWEFVGCPAGANPRTAPRPLSPTFGPQETFLGLNERYYGLNHPGFDAVLVPWLSGPEKETVFHGQAEEVLR